MFQFKRLLAEFVGTTVLVTGVIGALIVHAGTRGMLGLVGIGLVAGLTLCALMYSLGHISGGHFNPAITIALALVRKFPMQQVLPYVAAQLLGGVAAVGLIKYGLQGMGSEQMLGELSVMDNVHPAQAFGIEIFIAFVLTFVFISVTTDKRALGSAGLPIGLVFAVLIMIATPISGGAMNPARVIGPALFTQEWAQQWIWLLGPIVGATLGAVFYEFVRGGEPPHFGAFKKKLL